MRKSLTALLIVASPMSFALAQPPGERDGRGGDHRPPNAVLAAIDSNGDHEISNDEMKNAFTALTKLDSNKDGKLDREELHPEIAGHPGGSEGRGADSKHAEDAREDVVKRITGFDKNSDGKLTKDEIPARMQRVVARYDKNEDDVLDKEELAAMTEQLAASVPAQRGGPGGRSGFDGPPGRPPRDSGRGRPGGGPPSPEQMIQDAFEFDANGDGQLSKSELSAFAESHARRGPRRGRGGLGGRGDNRPSRPARPE